jgi:hypothetical protein
MNQQQKTALRGPQYTSTANTYLRPKYLKFLHPHQTFEALQFLFYTDMTWEVWHQYSTYKRQIFWRFHGQTLRGIGRLAKPEHFGFDRCAPGYG